jgi:16S rRNA (cytosine1402-N4)-methyltransferase
VEATLVEHQPVLYEEVLALLAPSGGERYVDCTVNGGGHAEGLLARSAPDGRLLGLDADPAAIARAERRLERYAPRVHLMHANFRELARCAEAAGWDTVDGILLDLGFSSYSLEASERGFSFRRDEPLDMRFDPTRGITAAELLAGSTEADLRALLQRYGEEPGAGRVARAIVRARAVAPLQTSGQLAALVERVLGTKRGRIHPATRTFQALRIAVNDELGALDAALEQAVPLLASGGRLAVISFHSLEDRIVKRFLRAESGECRCPPGLPICVCGATARVALTTRRAVRPTAEEVERNPRARSARLRGAVRLPAAA